MSIRRYVIEYRVDVDPHQSWCLWREQDVNNWRGFEIHLDAQASTFAGIEKVAARKRSRVVIKGVNGETREWAK